MKALTKITAAMLILYFIFLNFDTRLVPNSKPVYKEVYNETLGRKINITWVAVKYKETDEVPASNVSAFETIIGIVLTLLLVYSLYREEEKRLELWDVEHIVQTEFENRKREGKISGTFRGFTGAKLRQYRYAGSEVKPLRWEVGIQAEDLEGHPIFYKILIHHQGLRKAL